MRWNAASTFAPVGLILGERREHKIVRTLSDAARVLILDWPNDDGEQYIIAVKACVDAISGDITAETFRDAFLLAASEAGAATFAIVSGNAA